MITLSSYLGLSATLLFVAVLGFLRHRNHLILLLMSLELMLLAVNMNFVAISHFLGDRLGDLFVFFVLTVAAAEAAVGLALVVVLFRQHHNIGVGRLKALKG